MKETVCREFQKVPLTCKQPITERVLFIRIDMKSAFSSFIYLTLVLVNIKHRRIKRRGRGAFRKRVEVGWEALNSPTFTPATCKVRSVHTKVQKYLKNNFLVKHGLNLFSL